MKKFLVVFVSALLLMALSNFALSGAISPLKVGVVNLKLLINKSHDVLDLKNERQEQVKNLNKFIEDKKNFLETETNISKRKMLEEKYNEEYAAKKLAAQKTYETKLDDLQKQFYKLIGKEAKNSNYDLVLSKSSVLYGGEDMTESLIQKVK